MTFVQASQTSYQDIQNLYYNHLQLNLFSILVISAFLVFGTTAYIMTRPRSIYLVEYAFYRPSDQLQVKHRLFMEHSRLTGDFDESYLEFQCKILERSGLGETTYLPKAMHCIPLRPTLAAAHEEAEQVMFGALDNLFKSTNMKPKDIGILVVNWSLFNPMHSHSAEIVNKYKLRGNISS